MITTPTGRVTRVMVGTTAAKASIVYMDGTHAITVRIEGLDQHKALAIFTAIERLLNGAYVFDGDDLAIIRDGMRVARSEISGLAPEAQSATNALGSLETALAHLGVA